MTREWNSVDDPPEWWAYECEGLTLHGKVIDVLYSFDDYYGDCWYPNDHTEYEDPEFTITHWRPYQ